MRKYYLLLTAAIACEAFGTAMLKASDGFTQLIPAILFAIGYIACFIFLTFAIKKLPLGVAYGIWAGVGVAASAVIGVIFFGDAMNWVIALGIALVIGGVVALETSSNGDMSD